MSDNKIDVDKINDLSGVVIAGEKNQVITINIQNSDLKEYLKSSNESKPGLNSNVMPENIGVIKDSLDKMSDAFNKYKNSKEIHVEDEHITRTDLVIKKAILLKTEAEQIWFDHINKRRKELGRVENDMNELRQGFDRLNYERKLHEAYTILEGINKSEPTNTEVLLNMAKLLMVLTPDDPTDEEKLLYKVVNLVSEPKNETEKFQLAQANLYLSISSRPFNHGAIKSARKMFSDLGRAEWVSHVDNILKDNEPGSVSTVSQNMHQQSFQFPGKWQVIITDAFGSTMMMDLLPTGMFTASQQSAGISLSANGNWSYDPVARSVYFQGWVNNYMPFLMQIFIESFFQDGFQGIGADGIGYQFRKVR